ncbi:hypothetical protein D3C78_1757890 [compost metagenome]
MVNVDELIKRTTKSGLLGHHFRYGAQLVQPGKAAEQEAEVFTASFLLRTHQQLTRQGQG